jgi:hypothetical protein
VAICVVVAVDLASIPPLLRGAECLAPLLAALLSTHPPNHQGCLRAALAAPPGTRPACRS